MYNGTNPSALRSRDWLHAALIHLLKERKYNQISIKEICVQADLSRQTFYQIFCSKDEIMEYHFSILFKEFRKYCDQYSGITILEITQCFFKFFYNHKDFVSILIENNLICFLQHQFEYYLRQIELFHYYNHREGHYTDYTVAFISGALTQILVHWCKSNFELSVETISTLTQSILTGSVFQTDFES